MDALTAFLTILKSWVRSPLNLDMDAALKATQETVALLPDEYDSPDDHELLVSLVECMIESRRGYAMTPAEAVEKAAEKCKPMQEAANA